MKPITREWVAKAEGDFNSALREIGVRSNPNYDDACFHGQQCVEKYMKALLQEQDTTVPKTHNLPALLEMLLHAQPSWEELRDRLDALNDFAVHIRYPGTFADEPAAREALDIAQEVRKRARGLLALE